MFPGHCRATGVEGFFSSLDCWPLTVTDPSRAASHFFLEIIFLTWKLQWPVESTVLPLLKRVAAQGHGPVGGGKVVWWLFT